MSTDTLTQDIHDYANPFMSRETAGNLAEHLTTRGWRQQQTITTVEELEALPAGAVVRDNGNDVSERRSLEEHDGRDWYCIGIYDTLPTSDIELPARVLYIPEEQ